MAEHQQDKHRTEADQQIVQYIIVRTDLAWGTGATIAQACHACIASIASTLNDDHTKSYLADLHNMHKIILKAESLEDLNKCEQKLKESDVAYHLWIEKPENVPSSLAVSPQPRFLVKSLFKHLKLLK